jgi:hypothetical protein
MSLFYDSENFELSTDIETNSLLAELPFQLIKETITEQINDPLSTNIDYIDIIIEKCDMFKSSYENDEDVIAELNENLHSFFAFIITKIDDKFDLGLDVNTIASSGKIVEIGQVLYRYFILRYVKNISKFITKYIMKHKKELAEYYNDKNKKDVSTLAFKKQIKNPEDLSLITNLPSIIKYIINLDIEPYDFVDLSTGSDNYEGTMIKSLINSNQMIGDFVDGYIGLSIHEHDYIIDEIHTDIKMRLTKKIMK